MLFILGLNPKVDWDIVLDTEITNKLKKIAAYLNQGSELAFRGMVVDYSKGKLLYQ